MLKRFPMLVVLLASSALMALNGQNLNGQNLPVCEGAGIYRSFNVVRQFKLATAYFVNPSLPDRVRILYAYNLDEALEDLGSEVVAEQIESEEMQLSLPVYTMEMLGSSEVVVPEQVEDEVMQLSLSVDRDVAWAPSSYMSHCYPVFDGVVMDPAVAVDVPVYYTPVSAPENLMEWFGNLPPEDTTKFHVLSGNDFDSDAYDRVITWDPDESVDIIRFIRGDDTGVVQGDADQSTR